MNFPTIHVSEAHFLNAANPTTLTLPLCDSTMSDPESTNEAFPRPQLQFRDIEPRCKSLEPGCDQRDTHDAKDNARNSRHEAKKQSGQNQYHAAGHRQHSLPCSTRACLRTLVQVGKPAPRTVTPKLLNAFPELV
jgi:hypothetical protein